MGALMYTKYLPINRDVSSYIGKMKRESDCFKHNITEYKDLLKKTYSNNLDTSCLNYELYLQPLQ